MGPAPRGGGRPAVCKRGASGGHGPHGPGHYSDFSSVTDDDGIEVVAAAETYEVDKVKILKKRRLQKAQLPDDGDDREDGGDDGDDWEDFPEDNVIDEEPEGSDADANEYRSTDIRIARAGQKIENPNKPHHVRTQTHTRTPAHTHTLAWHAISTHVLDATNTHHLCIKIHVM